jgi:hypothetical protein
VALALPFRAMLLGEARIVIREASLTTRTETIIF